MSLRSSVLDEFKEHNGVMGMTAPTLANIASENDFLVLEDESGRIRLSGKMAESLNADASVPTTIGMLVTGIAVALRGKVDTSIGVFNVNDSLFYGEAAAAAAVSLKNKSNGGATEMDVDVDGNNNPMFLMLVSGIEAGASSDDSHMLSSQMLMDFIAGRLGGEEDRKKASQMVRVIFAGNNVTAASTDSQTIRGDKAAAARQLAEATEPSKSFDLLLAQCVGSCYVDVMPGANDPANHLLPQQPLHPCLYPHCSRFNTLSLVTNPCELRINGKLITGHSGQPVADIERQTMVKASVDTSTTDIDNKKNNESMEIDENQGPVQSLSPPTIAVLESTMRWGHLCPTAPDTLPCYPFTDKDPFIISEDRLPNLLFSGNATHFDTSVWSSSGHNTRLVCIPSFKTTGEVVLVDLNSPTLECSTISFAFGKY